MTATRKVSSLQEVKEIFLEELKNDPFVYVNENGKLDVQKPGEVNPDGHLKEMAKRKRKDYVKTFVNRFKVPAKDRINLEAHLRAVEFAGMMFGPNSMSELGDTFVPELTSLLLSVYKRGQSDTKKTRKTKLKKRRKRKKK